MRYLRQTRLISTLLLTAALLFPAALRAEDDDLVDLRAEMAREMAAFFEEAEAERLAFRDERDRDFAEFLQEQWKEFEAFSGLVPDRTPKPVKVPTIAKPKDAVQPAGRVVTPLPAPVKTPESPQVAKAPVVKPELIPPPPEKKPAGGPAESQPSTPPIPAPNEEPAVKPTVQPPVHPVPPAIAPGQPSPPEKAPAEKPVPTPAPSVVEAEPPVEPQGPAIELDFYGNRIRIPCDPALKASLAGAPGNQTIAAYWQEVSRANFPPTIGQLLLLRDQLRLNDWGYYRLAMQTAETLQGTGNNATLFCWFLLCKSGYRAKVGHSGDTLYLLVPTEQLLYNIPYYSLDGIRYYNFSTMEGKEKPGRLFTYQENYPGAEKTVRLQLDKTPALSKASATRQLKFSYAGKNYEVPVIYNPNAMNFFASYPQTDLPVFFTAAIETETEQSLLAGLAPLIAGKSETEAVNILLRFVQTAFEYKTDEEQFGREKYLFTEETLFFPYSDCEDRSILFSHLVRRLTGMEVIALHYPGHIATGVRFSEQVAGDQIEDKGETFVICDPTYINADIGMAMPQFKGVKPEVIGIGL